MADPLSLSGRSADGSTAQLQPHLARALDAVEIGDCEVHFHDRRLHGKNLGCTDRREYAGAKYDASCIGHSESSAERYLGVTNGETNEDKDRYLGVLISEYEMAREDERNILNFLGATFAIAATLAGVIVALLQQTCTFDSREGCYNLNEYLLAGVPLVPLICLGMIQAAGLMSIVRTYYLRALEIELQKFTPGPFAAIPPIKSPSYMLLMNEITSLRRGRPGFRFLVGLILIGAAALFGGLTVYIASNVSVGPRILMAGVYIPFTALIIFELTNFSLNGRSLFSDIAESYIRHSSEPFPAVSENPAQPLSRSLGWYLLLPRPDDAIKTLIAPAVLILLVLGGAVSVSLTSFLVLWTVFELIVYPARYQWNDIRGYASDISHPRNSIKARLPISNTSGGKGESCAPLPG